MTNATKNLDASRHEVINKLIDYNSTQNELIFSTRKRLFQLEHSFRLTILFSGLIAIVYIMAIALVVSHG